MVPINQVQDRPLFHTRFIFLLSFDALLALFYTFHTIDGQHVSLTGRHNIPVFVDDTQQRIFLPASKVTSKHRLIMHNRHAEIVKITKEIRVGFYSPLTMSSYLFVNNISTSVFSVRYEYRIR